jgi:uncharacterized protein YecT (DUF1311 family)
MIRLLALAATVAFGIHASTDVPVKSATLVPALQQCIEGVEASAKAGGDDSDVPNMADCISVGTNACQNESGASTPQGIVVCDREEQAFWEALLSFSYDSLRTSLPASAFRSLEAAQKAWLPWRAARCKFVFDSSGSAADSPDYLSFCLMETTGERAIDLLDVMEGG